MSFDRLFGTAIDKALTLGAEFTEVRYHKRRIEELVIKNGRVEAIWRGVDEGLCVRVLVDGCLGFSSTNVMTEKSIEKTIERCVKIARVMKKLLKEPVKLASTETHDVNYVVTERVKWENVDIREKIQYFRDLDKVLAQEKQDVKVPYRVFEIRHVLEEKLYENSEGTTIASKIPRLSIDYVITCVKNGQSIQRYHKVGGTGGWETILKTNFEEKVKSDVDALGRELIFGKKSPTGKMDVLVSPEIAGIIAHEAVGHPFEADRILGREAAQAGESYMKIDDIGKEIASEEVYVSDDPTIPSSYGYYLYDDEGVKARKKELIKKGRVTEFLHNRETASELGIKSNGSARAMCYSVEPIVRMSNTYFEPGDYSFEELLEDIKFGIYIKSFMEWNIDDKRVNQRYVGLEAYLIENGEIKYPVRQPVIETTTFELLKKLDARGRDLEFDAGTCGKGEPIQGIPVWMGGPHLRFRKLKITVR